MTRADSPAIRFRATMAAVSLLVVSCSSYAEPHPTTAAPVTTGPASPFPQPTTVTGVAPAGYSHRRGRPTGKTPKNDAPDPKRPTFAEVLRGGALDGTPETTNRHTHRATLPKPAGPVRRAAWRTAGR